MPVTDLASADLRSRLWESAMALAWASFHTDEAASAWDLLKMALDEPYWSSDANDGYTTMRGFLLRKEEYRAPFVGLGDPRGGKPKADTYERQLEIGKTFGAAFFAESRLPRHADLPE